MNLMQICTDHLVTVKPGAPIIEAARLMRDNHVGAVVVMSDLLPPGPVGILTDRDIVIRAVAFAGQKTMLTVDQVMSPTPMLVPGSMHVHEALKLMRKRGVRRLLVTGEHGRLKGVVSFDDMVMLFSEELTDMAKAMAASMQREA